MDFWIDMGFAVLLRVLKDRKAFPKYQEAYRKLVRTYQRNFPTDEIWAEVCDRKESR